MVIDGGLVGSMATLPIARSEPARSAPTAAPREIATAQVVEHGLRHMAWLAKDDPVVAVELPAGWRDLLAEYVPEPSVISAEEVQMDAESITVRCVCGWEATGSEDVVIEATRDHGPRIHNMTPTREEVLAMAVAPTGRDDAPRP